MRDSQQILPQPEWPNRRSSTPPAPQSDSSLRLRPSAPSSLGSPAEPRASTPPPLPRPIPTYVDVATVRALYDEYMRVVGPVAKAVFEQELRALHRLPSTLSELDCALLVERLTARIPIAGARARFLTATHDLLR